MRGYRNAEEHTEETIDGARWLNSGVMKLWFAAAILLISLPHIAAAQGKAMTRVLSCQGPDASMEVYLPQSAVKGRGADGFATSGSLLGEYSLDLTGAGKGKQLEQVRISISRDRKSVIVDQFTRKLPPTRIPIAGGVVNFDNRFGTNAKCGPFNQE